MLYRIHYNISIRLFSKKTIKDWQLPGLLGTINKKRKPRTNAYVYKRRFEETP